MELDIEQNVSDLEVLSTPTQLDIGAPQEFVLEIQQVREVTVLEIGVSGPQGPPGEFAKQEEFTATEEQTTFDLSDIATKALVYINGLLQPVGEYSVSSNQIIFTSGTGIALGDLVTVLYA